MADMIFAERAKRFLEYIKRKYDNTNSQAIDRYCREYSQLETAELIKKLQTLMDPALELRRRFVKMSHNEPNRDMIESSYLEHEQRIHSLLMLLQSMITINETIILMKIIRSAMQVQTNQ